MPGTWRGGRATTTRDSSTASLRRWFFLGVNFKATEIGAEKWTQTFFFKLFGHPWRIPAKIPGYEDPYPTGNIRTQKFGFVLFFFRAWGPQTDSKLTLSKDLDDRGSAFEKVLGSNLCMRFQQAWAKGFLEGGSQEKGSTRAFRMQEHALSQRRTYLLYVRAWRSREKRQGGFSSFIPPGTFQRAGG